MAAAADNPTSVGIPQLDGIQGKQRLGLGVLSYTSFILPCVYCHLGHNLRVFVHAGVELPPADRSHDTAPTPFNQDALAAQAQVLPPLAGGVDVNGAAVTVSLYLPTCTPCPSPLAGPNPRIVPTPGFVADVPDRFLDYMAVAGSHVEVNITVDVVTDATPTQHVFLSPAFTGLYLYGPILIDNTFPFTPNYTITLVGNNLTWFRTSDVFLSTGTFRAVYQLLVGHLGFGFVCVFVCSWVLGLCVCVCGTCWAAQAGLVGSQPLNAHPA